MLPAPSIELPFQDAQCVSHIALDIGGSLIKLVYFSPEPPVEKADPGVQTATNSSHADLPVPAEHAAGPNGTGRGGRLHFVKFETSRVEDAIAFIEAKGLHRFHGRGGTMGMRVKATGGGVYKYADLFRERLGVVLENGDEMGCMSAGCNFLLKAITHEAFTFENGAANFVPATDEAADLYPYLLVNIGSGVSMVKVTGEGQYERVSGSSLGGGTFWGLCRLLTGVKDFDAMLELSMQGDNANVDMLVGDIYGGRDYTSIGLSASTIASSFGKVISQDKALEDYNPADLCMALCRMVSYNIGQLAYLNAMRYNIKRIYFGGFFIRGHPYTMETISYAIKFWSKGGMAAMFLRHEGFLGSVGAFLLVHPAMSSTTGLGESTDSTLPSKVRARFVERFSTGAPLTGGEVVGPAIENLQGKVSWVEKFVALGGLPTSGTSTPYEAPIQAGGAPATVPSAFAAAASGPTGPVPRARTLPVATSSGAPCVPGLSGGIQRSTTLDRGVIQRSTTLDQPASPAVRMALHVGVLHYSPSYVVFPLLHDPASYQPSIISSGQAEFKWWIQLLEDQIAVLGAKASKSQGDSEEAKRRAAAFHRAFAAHMTKLRVEPGAYGALGLAEVFEMREECLREFGFDDVYRADKRRENTAALQVLPDLLAELDALPPGRARWLSLVEGALAANIFDWGANACVALYRAGTILDIYREARSRLNKRPWAQDDFDALCEKFDLPTLPYRRALMFVDNAGADVVLGQLPLARELLRSGCDVVMVANQLPAINDITADELKEVLGIAELQCSIIKAGRQAARQAVHAHGGRVPPAPGTSFASGTSPALYVVGSGSGSPCFDFRRVPDVLAEAAAGADLIIVEGMGRAIHSNYNARFKCDSLLLAMIKTERLAKYLFGPCGQLYDCVCKYVQAPEEGPAVEDGGGIQAGSVV